MERNTPASVEIEQQALHYVAHGDSIGAGHLARLVPARLIGLVRCAIAWRFTTGVALFFIKVLQRGIVEHQRHL